MASGEALLEVSDLGRRDSRSGTWLLRHVALVLEAGQRVAVVGSSGAGKSLLLRAIAMLDPFDEGTIRFHGETIAAESIPHYRSQVVYLHQRPVLMGSTVRDALEAPLKLGIHADKQWDPDQVGQWLKDLALDPTFLDKRTSNLSGGELQVASLIRALQLIPTVLLLDEPTASMDPRTSAAASELLVDWGSRDTARRAMIWVTHDRQGTARHVTHCVEMRHGELSQDPGDG
jgi:putative ABC transport system ATP-binding protein